MGKGIFISIEGNDGSGKTTQINRMKTHLEGKGLEVLLVREPGGTPISEKIRPLILDPVNTEMDPAAEMLLYAASRAQLVSQVIRPALQKGKVVICDRFVDSSYVYQGFGRGIDLKVVEQVNAAATNGVEPDITFFLDIDPEIAMKRRIAATGVDRLEGEKLEFHRRVYLGYKELEKRFPSRIRSINAARSVEEISRDIAQWLDRLLA